ncbi:MAG: protein kinase [Planctomycetes bacterium]|nr:protein kinase [Planctomycetota bacterium]
MPQDTSPKDYFKNKKRYTPVGHLGTGGMAVVSESLDEYFQRNIAFKTLKDAKHPKHVREFTREGKIMASLEHPGIVPIYELTSDDKASPCITMGKVSGLSLNEKVAEARKDPSTWPFGERLQVFTKLVQVVSYAHNKDILHRDIKPSNVMLGEYGVVILLDWGLAKVMDKKKKFKASHSSRMAIVAKNSQDSVNGAIKGTPYYMSPEAAKGKIHQVDEQSDVFSLGAMLYEMLSLKFLIRGTKTMEVLKNAANSQYHSIKDKAFDEQAKHFGMRRIPEELEFIIQKCINPDKKERFASASELLTALNNYQNDLPIKGFGSAMGAYHIKKYLARNWFFILMTALPIFATLWAYNHYEDLIKEDKESLESTGLEGESEVKKEKKFKGRIKKLNSEIAKKESTIKKNEDKLANLESEVGAEDDNFMKNWEIHNNIITKLEEEKRGLNKEKEDNIKLHSKALIDLQEKEEKFKEKEEELAKKQETKNREYYLSITPELTLAIRKAYLSYRNKRNEEGLATLKKHRRGSYSPFPAKILHKMLTLKENPENHLKQKLWMSKLESELSPPEPLEIDIPMELIGQDLDSYQYTGARHPFEDIYLLANQSYGRMRYRDWHLDIEDYINSWRMEDFKQKYAFWAGDLAWIVLGRNGNLFYLNNDSPARPIMSSDLNLVVQVFPIREENTLFIQTHDYTLHLAHLNTGQYLFPLCQMEEEITSVWQDLETENIYFDLDSTDQYIFKPIQKEPQPKAKPKGSKQAK